MHLLELSLNDEDGSVIRGSSIIDEPDRWSVYDTINFVRGNPPGHNYAHTYFSRLVKEGSEYQEELQSLCQHFKFPGSGQRETPTMTIRGIQRLLIIMGGKVASEYRALVETTFTRVMAGDRSLIKVIESNATSNTVFSKACHAALVNDPSPGGILKDNALDNMTIKNQKEDRALDIRKRKIEIDIMESEARFDDESRQLKIQRENLEIQKNTLEIQKNALELIALKYSTCQASIQAVAADSLMDSKTKVFMTDQIKNDMLDSRSNLINQMRLIDNGEAVQEISPSLSISQITHEKGLAKTSLTTKDLASIGKLVARKYHDKHDRQEPLKSVRSVNGMEVKVNAYTEDDRDIIEAAVEEFKLNKNGAAGDNGKFRQLKLAI